jgi:TolB-like protein/predicted Zn-dependent protease
MALAFFTSPDAPVNCAIELAKADQANPELELRMGIHSGPVDRLTDVNERTNLAGAGMNMAQRVMDCGDAGHILLSQRIADDLEQYDRWRPVLHNLGEVELKHGVRLGIVSLHNGEFGNAAIPTRINQAREECAALRHRAEKARRRRIIVGAAATVLLLVSIGIGTWVWQRHVPFTSASATSDEKSIAVLPLENLSEDKENAYFAGGVQDEILSNLAKVADLKVISRTSVMKYNAGPERNLREIAKTLGVSYVVEGSVQRAGGRVRVNAQLIDARNDTHLWAEHYDREFADIFAIQSEIAQRIADQLRARLSEPEKSAIAERPTSDLVAYAFYTKARELDLSVNWEGDEKNLNQKVELLEKATQRDPNFALAYCANAKTQIDLSSLTGEPETRVHLELAKKAAEAALRVRPDLGEAHLEMARCYFYSFDYQRAREELKIVRSKLPNNAEALVIEAMIGRHENRWDASLVDLEKAYDLDPRNDEVAWRLGQTYFEMRLYAEYEQHVRKQVANGLLNSLDAQFGLARAKLAQGDPVAAQSLLEQVSMDFSPYYWIWSIRFEAALYLHDYDAASRIIAATPEKWANNAFGEQTSSWAEGQVARARGDKQTALAAFATARKKMEATLGDRPDAIYLSELATLDAGLGRKEEATREALRAVELLPISKDAVNAPGLIANLAVVYAWTGERDHALEQLAKVVTIPGAMGTVPTYGDLRFNPCWDDLRADPRFDEIVAAAKAASR